MFGLVQYEDNTAIKWKLISRVINLIVLQTMNKGIYLDVQLCKV